MGTFEKVPRCSPLKNPTYCGRRQQPRPASLSQKVLDPSTVLRIDPEPVEWVDDPRGVDFHLRRLYRSTGFGGLRRSFCSISSASAVSLDLATDGFFNGLPPPSKLPIGGYRHSKVPFMTLWDQGLKRLLSPVKQMRMQPSAASACGHPMVAGDMLRNTLLCMHGAFKRDYPAHRSFGG